MKRTIILEFIAFLFVMLFVYAALTKAFDYEKFTIQISQSPLLTGFGKVIAPFVIITELVTAALLAFHRLRLIAFFSCFCLMTAFTAYIVFILRFSSYIPCSCGGVLEKLGWTEHLIFNTGFVMLAFTGIILQAQQNRQAFTESSAQ